MGANATPPHATGSAVVLRAMALMGNLGTCVMCADEVVMLVIQVVISAVGAHFRIIVPDAAPRERLQRHRDHDHEGHQQIQEFVFSGEHVRIMEFPGHADK